MTSSVTAVSRLRRSSEALPTARERLAALFGAASPETRGFETGGCEPQGWVPQQDPSVLWGDGDRSPAGPGEVDRQSDRSAPSAARTPVDGPVPVGVQAEAPRSDASILREAPGTSVPPAPGALGASVPPEAAGVRAPAESALPVGGQELVPSPLRGGRWEPGRRGALALGAVAALAAVLAGFFVLRSRPTEVTAPPLLRPAATASPSPAGVVVVAVAGRVKRQGLVRLPLGARVDDALRAAGGVAPGADIGLLNLARLLVDGEQLLVGIPPPPGSAAAPGGPTGGGPGRPSVAGAKVDLNAASVSDLDGLPGIGPVLAQHILDWRTEHGRFASVDQLREVPGIGEAKYASLRDKVRV